MKNRLLALALSLPLVSGGQSIFPIKISENHRYFVTQQGRPFLCHADTGWQIFAKLTTEEAIEYLAFRKEQGFNAIQVQIAMDPAQTNRYGRLPFEGE